MTSTVDLLGQTGRNFRKTLRNVIVPKLVFAGDTTLKMGLKWWFFATFSSEVGHHRATWHSISLRFSLLYFLDSQGFLRTSDVLYEWRYWWLNDVNSYTKSGNEERHFPPKLAAEAKISWNYGLLWSIQQLLNRTRLDSWIFSFMVWLGHVLVVVMKNPALNDLPSHQV